MFKQFINDYESLRWIGCWELVVAPTWSGCDWVANAGLPCMLLLLLALQLTFFAINTKFNFHLQNIFLYYVIMIIQNMLCMCPWCHGVFHITFIFWFIMLCYIYWASCACKASIWSWCCICVLAISSCWRLLSCSISCWMRSLVPLL